MLDAAKPLNAVAAIQVSTTKQGTKGDSPEAQKAYVGFNDKDRSNYLDKTDLLEKEKHLYDAVVEADIELRR